MNKRANTIFFVLGATLFNILTTIITFALLVFAYTRIISLTGGDSESTGSVGIPFIFIGAIVSSFFIYKAVLKQITKKYDMDKYFAPIFGYSRPQRKNTD